MAIISLASQDLDPAERALVYPEDGLMLNTAIGVGVGVVVLICAGLYSRKRSRSRQFLSTSDWVKLMRQNDSRAEAGVKRKTHKYRPPEAHA